MLVMMCFLAYSGFLWREAQAQSGKLWHACCRKKSRLAPVLPAHAHPEAAGICHLMHPACALRYSAM